ncbi:hypothetical protein LY474_00975 [Myxococcus stipitatus]|uniref:hypothetical protein n=1 Tax=Myxococcus stipitatus TaxID=83455 RepID=UPI001F306E3C|nr:hypothetical protein [Myxococcus stipitatus]MCE9666370.1 hypothetical protein [Myxococcus stipitatus]
MGISFLATGFMLGCGGVEAPRAEEVAFEQEQSLVACPSGYTSVPLWECEPLAAHAPPCRYGGPGYYNVLHLYCQSGTDFYDAGPTGTYACGDCF